MYKIIIAKNRIENHCVNNNQENEEEDNLKAEESLKSALFKAFMS
jgi:hypothetical protein